MAVQIKASLDRTTVAQLLAELTPLTIDLDEDDSQGRWIQIGVPDGLEFIAGRGIRIHTTARLQWTVAGLNVPVTISSLSMLLAPVIAPSPSGGRLNLEATLEEADLKHVPELIEEGIVARVNARLAARPDAFGWDFGKTLALHKALPASMAPVHGFEMNAHDGALEIDSQAVWLSVELSMHFLRG